MLPGTRPGLKFFKSEAVFYYSGSLPTARFHFQPLYFFSYFPHLTQGFKCKSQA